MVVVNADAARSLCIWRANRFRAKLCYRSFYIHALLGRNRKTICRSTAADLRPKAELRVASWNNRPAAKPVEKSA